MDGALARGFDFELRRLVVLELMVSPIRSPAIPPAPSVVEDDHEHYADRRVIEQSSVCVFDGEGKIIERRKLQPEALIQYWHSVLR